MGKYTDLVEKTLNEGKVLPKIKRKLKFKHTDQDGKFEQFEYAVGDSWVGADNVVLVTYIIAFLKDGKFYIAHDQSGNSMDIIPANEMGKRVKRDLRDAVSRKQWDKEEEQQKKEEEQRLIDRVSLYGYEKDFTTLQLGKIAKALEVKIYDKGKDWFMRDWVYDMVVNRKAIVKEKGFSLDGKLYKVKSKIPLNYGQYLATEFEEQINGGDYASDDAMTHLFGR